MLQELYAQFGLDAMTIDFIGHALALHQNDSYMAQVSQHPYGPLGARRHSTEAPLDGFQWTQLLHPIAAMWRCACLLPPLKVETGIHSLRH